VRWVLTRLVDAQKLTSHGTLQSLVSSGIIPAAAPVSPGSCASSVATLKPGLGSQLGWTPVANAHSTRRIAAIVEEGEGDDEEGTDEEVVVVVAAADVAQAQAQAHAFGQPAPASPNRVASPITAGNGGTMATPSVEHQSSGRIKELTVSRKGVPTSREGTPVFRARAKPPARAPRPVGAHHPPGLHPHQQWKWYSYNSSVDSSGHLARGAGRDRVLPGVERHTRSSSTLAQVNVDVEQAHVRSAPALPGLSRLGRQRRYPVPKVSPIHTAARGRLGSRRHRRRVAARGLTHAELGLGDDGEGGMTTGVQTGSGLQTVSVSAIADVPAVFERDSRTASPTARLRASSLMERMPAIGRRSGRQTRRHTRRGHSSGATEHLPSVVSRGKKRRRRKARGKVPAPQVDLTIGPDQGTVRNQFMGLLSVGRSPDHELASPYGLAKSMSQPESPSMLHEHQYPSAQ